MAVARLALGKYGSGGDVERGKQGGGTVAYVVVRDALDVAQAHGQDRLGTAVAQEVSENQSWGRCHLLLNAIDCQNNGFHVPPLNEPKVTMEVSDFQW